MSYQISVRLDSDLIVTLDKRYKSKDAAGKAIDDVLKSCVASRTLAAGRPRVLFYPPHRFRYAFVEKARLPRG